MNVQIRNGTRSAASTSEQVICATRCVLYGIYPELTTTGTITIRNGEAGTTKHVAAIGLTQAGKTFGGVVFDKGLTVQQSVDTDRHLIVWEPY